MRFFCERGGRGPESICSPASRLTVEVDDRTGDRENAESLPKPQQCSYIIAACSACMGRSVTTALRHRPEQPQSRHPTSTTDQGIAEE